MTDTTKAWWKDALERLLWTFIQGATAILTAAQFGWVEMGDGQLWKAAAAGGVAAVFSLLKSFAAERLTASRTAQWGAKTYSYTEQGPGSAGADMEGGNANLGTVLTVVLIILVVVVIVRMV
jgi:hypothetical protein